MTLAAFSAEPLLTDYQRINTLARTITYKYVDVNGKISPPANALDAKGLSRGGARLSLQGEEMTLASSRSLAFGVQHLKKINCTMTRSGV